MTSSERTDSLTIRAQRTSSAKFQAAYERHSETATRFAYLLTGDREEADDIVQEAFVRLCGRFARLTAPERFEGYLFKTVLNLVRDRGRKLAREHAALARAAPLVQRDMGCEHTEPLWDLLLNLPPRQRAVIFLRYYEDLSEAKTAEMLGCSTGAVKSLSQRAMVTLREALGKGQEDG